MHESHIASYPASHTMRVHTLSEAGRQRVHDWHGMLPIEFLKKCSEHSRHECGSDTLLLCTTSKLTLHRHSETLVAARPSELDGHGCCRSSLPSQKKSSAHGTHSAVAPAPAPARTKLGRHTHASCRVRPLVHSSAGQACCRPPTQEKTTLQSSQRVPLL